MAFSQNWIAAYIFMTNVSIRGHEPKLSSRLVRTYDEIAASGLGCLYKYHFYVLMNDFGMSVGMSVIVYPHYR